MAIVFAQTRTTYAPYADFWRIVQLSGFPIKYLDEIDWTAADTVIATPRNGEWSAIPAVRQARLVHWMLERPRPERDEMNSIHQTADEIWASDTLLAEQVGGRYVFLGGVETFANVNVLRRRDYDLIALMYWSPRRDGLRHELLEEGLTLVDPNGNCWGEWREQALNSSRIMLNAHQDEYPWCEPIKFCLAGMYGLPLLSETSAGSGYWEPGFHYISAPLADLVTWAKYLLTDDVALARLGAHAWRLVCRDHTFKQEVEAAVKAQVAA